MTIYRNVLKNDSKWVQLGGHKMVLNNLVKLHRKAMKTKLTQMKKSVNIKKEKES